MKLSVILITLLPVVLAAPVPQSELGPHLPDVPSVLENASSAVKVSDEVGKTNMPVNIDSISVRDFSSAFEIDIDIDMIKARDDDGTTDVDGLTSSIGLETIDDDGLFDVLYRKRALSPTEILANARKAVSAAESDYSKYPNEITKAAYMNAIETVKALIEPSN